MQSNESQTPAAEPATQETSSASAVEIALPALAAPKKKRRRKKVQSEPLKFWTPEEIKAMSVLPKGLPFETPALEIIRDDDASHEIAVQFEHVTKEYQVYKDDGRRLMHQIFHLGTPRIRRASNDLSFVVRRGESLALLGNNGAGKSTALKMITGVLQPTYGRITVHGRVSALLELRAGFDGKLTGRENLEFRCFLWGIPKDEAAELIPEIIEFSELKEYIDQPLRTYSSGMKARLGFGFASSIKPDILIVDEALSVGDQRFKKKCLERVRSIVEGDNVTVLFVTHSGRSAKQFCDRGLVLEKGHALYEGPIEQAVEFHVNR